MRYKNFIRIHIWEFGVLILNVFYFIPKTLEWLQWESGVTMGYVGIELVLNYFIHVFFIYSCISLLHTLNKKYNLYCLISIVSIYFVSFIFAFRVIEFIVFIPVFVYVFVFYKLLEKIGESKTIGKNMSIIGFIISLIWLVLDQKLFE